jgi:hypothetical protein
MGAVASRSSLKLGRLGLDFLDLTAEKFSDLGDGPALAHQFLEIG